MDKKECCFRILDSCSLFMIYYQKGKSGCFIPVLLRRGGGLYCSKVLTSGLYVVLSSSKVLTASPYVELYCSNTELTGSEVEPSGSKGVLASI